MNARRRQSKRDMVALQNWLAGSHGESSVQRIVQQFVSEETNTRSRNGPREAVFEETLSLCAFRGLTNVANQTIELDNGGPIEAHHGALRMKYSRAKPSMRHKRW